MARTGAGKTALILVDILMVASAGALAIAAFYFSRGTLPVMPGWVAFAGRLHPVLLHLPLGALVLMALTELVRGFRGKEALDGFLVFLVTISALFAALCGLALAMEGGYEEERLSYHMWLGIVAYAAMVLTFLLRLRVDPEAFSGPGAYRLMLIITASVIGAAGHYGGTITHGSGYLTEHADAALASLGIKPADTDSGGQAVTDTAPAGAYANQVAPVLDKYCVECHGPEKQKHQVRVDTLEWLTTEEGDGPLIVSGDSAESLLVQVMRMPMDAEYHMPPEGKSQPTPEEIDLVASWIDAGGNAEVPDLEAGDTTIPTEEALEEVVEETIEDAVVAVPAPVPPREALADSLAAFQSEFPGALNWVAQDTDQLSFTAVSFRSNFDDVALAKLAPFGPYLMWVDLAGTQVTSEGLAALLPQLSVVERLNLSGTSADPKVLLHLAADAPLRVLNLFESSADDGAAVVLARRDGIERIYAGNTAITEAAAEGLALLMPGIEVVGAAKLSEPEVEAVAEPEAEEAAPAEETTAEEVTAEETPADEAPAVDTAEATSSAVVYASQVAPILEANCYGCHGEDSQKSRIRVDSIAAMLAGNDDGPVLVAGDAEASRLLKVMALPEDEDLHMPPPNKPQPTAEQIAVIKKWIEEGGNAEAPSVEGAPTAEATAEEAPAPEAEVEAAPAALAYATQVVPVLEANCYGCHGEDSQKSRIRVDSIEAMLAGNDDGPVLVAGDAEASRLLKVMALPEDDDLHMPPPNKPQPTAEQVELVKKWIAAGGTMEVPAQ